MHNTNFGVTNLMQNIIIIAMHNRCSIENNCELINDDCFDFLPTVAKESVDMVFADPPYNLSNNGFTCQSGKAVSVNKGDWDASNGLEKDFEFHKKWLNECKRVLKKDGTLWLSGTYHSIYACGFALQSLGFHILNDICWYKPNASPNLSCRFFTASHETLIWARKSKDGKHTFNYEKMRTGVFRDFLKVPEKQMRSVWAIGTTPPSEKLLGKHPTQKPLELLDRIVVASTNEGDLVLDPFMGSGSTGVAALKRKRHFIGIEKDKEYYNLACNRISQEQINNVNNLFVGG